MDEIYKNIVFDIIADMLNKKKLDQIVTELFTRGRMLNFYFCYCCFTVPKNIRLNLTNYIIMKIPSKREVQQIAFNHSSYIDFKDFMNLYQKCTEKTHCF